MLEYRKFTVLEYCTRINWFERQRSTMTLVHYKLHFCFIRLWTYWRQMKLWVIKLNPFKSKIVDRIKLQCREAFCGFRCCQYARKFLLFQEFFSDWNIDVEDILFTLSIYVESSCVKTQSILLIAGPIVQKSCYSRAKIIVNDDFNDNDMITLSW